MSTAPSTAPPGGTCTVRAWRCPRSGAPCAAPRARRASLRECISALVTAFCQARGSAVLCLQTCTGGGPQARFSMLLKPYASLSAWPEAGVSAACRCADK